MRFTNTIGINLLLYMNYGKHTILLVLVSLVSTGEKGQNLLVSSFCTILLLISKVNLNCLSLLIN